MDKEILEIIKEFKEKYESRLNPGEYKKGVQDSLTLLSAYILDSRQQTTEKPTIQTTSKGPVAVFIAGGFGIRFANPDIPKSLIELGEKTLIEHSLSAVSKAGIKDAIIITGHKGDKIKEKVGNIYEGVNITYIDDYALKGTMYAVYLARSLLNRDALILEADLIYDPALIKRMVLSQHKNFLVLAPSVGRQDEVLVSSSDGLKIEKMGKEIEKTNIVGEFIGITKLSKEFLSELFLDIEKQGVPKICNKYCEDVFLEFAQTQDKPLVPLLFPDLTWTEIDTMEDLKRAKEEIYPKIFPNT